MVALPPTPIIVLSAMIVLNTGVTMETDATFTVSPSRAMKNMSAIL